MSTEWGNGSGGSASVDGEISINRSCDGPNRTHRSFSPTTEHRDELSSSVNAMKTFAILLCLSLVVATFAMELFDEEEEQDVMAIKRAMGDLDAIMKRGRKGRGTSYQACDEYGRKCICKVKGSKKDVLTCNG